MAKRHAADNLQLPEHVGKTTARTVRTIHYQLTDNVYHLDIFDNVFAPWDWKDMAHSVYLRRGYHMTNCPRSALFLNPLNGTDVSAVKRITIVTRNRLPIMHVQRNIYWAIQCGTKMQIE